MIDLSRMKVGTRLVGAFGVMVAVSLITAGVALKDLGDIQANLEDIVLDNNVKIRHGNALSDSAFVIGQTLRDALLLQDNQRLGEELAAMKKAREDYAKSWAALQDMPASEAGKAKRAAVAQAHAKAVAVNDRIMDLIKADKRPEALVLMKEEGRLAMGTLETAIEANITLQNADNDAVYAEAVADYRSARAWLIGLNAFCVAMAAFLGWLVTRSITRQLGGEPADAARVAQRVAEGDLGTRIDLRTGDTHSVMAQLAVMQVGLAKVVGSVRSNAESVATASAQISQGNADLSGRTEQQAAALEQTSATMDELGSTVRSNADNARQANELALGASAVAVRGGEVVGEAVSTMKGINDSSRKIADIIGVIDGIAFQTNILALNAAVEAARAGEQGRGFAVVAAEVRSLAKRAADAAREIKALITASVENVERGTAQVDQAGATMTEVVAAIRRVTDIMGEISRASTEQSTGVAQVGEAVAQMDQATQQNAALVEESAAAAESLRQQAQSLVKLVEVFRLSEGAQQVRL